MQQIIQMPNTKMMRNENGSSKHDQSLDRSQQPQRMSINQMSSKNSQSIPMWKISSLRETRIMATEADESQYKTNKVDQETTTPPEQMGFKLLQRPHVRKTMTEQLKVIDGMDPDNLKQCESMKKAFDVVYQPQVNIVREKEKVTDSPASTRSKADSQAMQVSERKRRKSQPMGNKKEAKKNQLRVDNADVTSNRSEEYVYKSPSKMTSPEKKAFS